ncbi:unnamed protein product [Tilletia controversa]|nr:unnamed protein product [Tilletia controversa]
MANAITTSPQGWSLTDAELQVVAALVASRSIKPGDDGADAASYRARAIVSVRTNRHKITPDMLRNIDLLCPPTREEIEAVRDTVTRWSVAEETHARRLSFIASLSASMDLSSSGTSSSAQPRTGSTSSRREEDTNSDIGLPEAKRARTAASTTTSTLAQRSSANQQGQTAAQRFFGIAELLKIVSVHLLYEKIDLVQLSRVSKFVRAVVLPLLVDTFNVCLNGIRGAHDFLAANPGLVQHVRFLRIWDDVAHRTARRYLYTISQERPHLVPDAYVHLGSFLMLFEDGKVVRQPPLLELSVGQSNLFELYSQLKRAPRVTLRLVSLQIVDDPDIRPPSFADIPFHTLIAPHLYHGTRLSEELSLLLSMVFDRQLEATGSVWLRSFSFTSLRIFRTGQGSILPMFGPRLLKTMASSLQTLRLHVQNITDIDNPTYELFLNLHWPKLKSLGIYAGLSELEDPYKFQRLLRGFLQHHPQLSHVYIDAVGDPSLAYTERQAYMNLWYFCTLPQLQSCWLQYPRPPLATLTDFLSRHATVEDIMLHPDQNPSILAGQPELMRSLRVLRCSAEGVETLLKAGPRIRELHLDFDTEWEWEPEHLMKSDVGTVPSVTFFALQLNLERERTAALPHQLDCLLLFMCKALPNLVELAVTMGYGQSVEKPDSEDESVEFLSSFLTRCRHTPECRLRAIRIEYKGAVRLPTEQGFLVAPPDLSPHLEYLVWSIPHLRTMQHFRVVDRQSSTSSITRRLQLLPASFRPQVDRATGVWEDLDNHQSTLSILDHTGDTVRPKVL